MWRSARRKASNDSEEVTSRIDKLADDNARLLRELDAMQIRFRGLARAVWRVQEDERRHLARELHDGVGQSLTALRHQLEQLPSGDGRDQCSELLLQILEDVRELSRLLRPPILDDLGLGPALNWLARRVGDSSGIEVELETSALNQVALPPDISTLVFRLVQEALHNVVRHANASQVRVQVSLTGNRLEVAVRDNGDGFDPARLAEDPERCGVGASGMRDRVTLLGGDFSLRSAPGHGTSIHAGIMLEENGGERP